MATIQFENGIKVNFEGQPTPQDIEEVSNQLQSQGKLSQPSNKEKIPWSQRPESSFTWKVSPEELERKASGEEGVSPIKSVARPLVNLLGLPLQTAEKLAKIPFNIADLYKEQGLSGVGQAGIDVVENLAAPFTWLGKNLLGLQSAGIKAMTGRSIDPEAEAATTKTVEALKHPLDTATNIATGAYQISQEEPMMLPLALEGGASGVNRLAGRKVLPPPVETIAQTVTKPVGAAVDYITAPIKSAAVTKRVSDFEKVFNMSKGMSATEVKYGKNSPQMAAQLESEGVDMKFGRDERGRLDTTAAQRSVSEVATRDNALMNKLLKDSDATIDLNQIEAAAKEAARIEYKGTAQDQALAHIENEMAAYRRQYAGDAILDEGPGGRFLLKADVANGIKQDLWSKSKFSPFASETENTSAGTKYLMGHEIKGVIEDTVGGDNIVGRLNARLGDIAQLEKVLQRAQGGAVHGGFMSRMFGRVVGGIAGAGGGPVGSVVGSITGDMVADALNNPNRPFGWAKMVLDRAQSEAPELLKEVEARLRTTAAERLARPRLKEPDYMEMGPETPPPPETPTIFGQTPDQYYEGIRQQNTLRLPAGNPNMIQGETVRLKAPYSQESQAQSMGTFESTPPTISGAVAKFETGSPVVTPAVRYSKAGLENTDSYRGGTWYATPESKTFDFTSEKSIGGPNKSEANVSMKNPLVIENSSIEEGSFAVINDGYEGYLSPQQARLANTLYEHFINAGEKGPAGFINNIRDVLIQNGNTPEQIKSVLATSDRFDAAMDLVISKGLREAGYDGLILENQYKGNVIDRHIFKVQDESQAKKIGTMKDSPQDSHFDEKKLVDSSQQAYKELNDPKHLSGYPAESSMTVGDVLVSNESRSHFSDIKDVPIAFMSDGDLTKVAGTKTKGAFATDSNGTRFIALNVNLPASEITRTLAEEMIHAKQVLVKGIKTSSSGLDGDAYDNFPQEVTAKKGAKYFSPAPTVSDFFEQQNKKTSKPTMSQSTPSTMFGRMSESPLKGISQDTKDWFDNWVNVESNDFRINPPSQKVVEELSKYKPTKPIKVYRAVPNESDVAESYADSMSSMTGYDSWTKSLKVAKEFASTRGGKVISKTVNPEDVLVDFDLLPKDQIDEMLGIFGNTEKEIIIRDSSGEVPPQKVSKPSPRTGGSSNFEGGVLGMPPSGQ